MRTQASSDGHRKISFQAMAGPCEVLVRCDDESLVRQAATLAENEARRIESKFSRYREDSTLHRINTSNGRETKVDEETASLLDFAEHCWEISEGAFDVTSGCLRRVWPFGSKDRVAVPTPTEVREVLKHVGWEKLEWSRPTIRLPEGMEIDFGGIGKEYAVDRVVALLQDLPGSFLVNFGGDIRATSKGAQPRPSPDDSWFVGLESPSEEDTAVAEFELTGGALATSGDARRFLMKDGVRYGHILDPRTGWPPEDAPRSVTVHAPTCLEAGLLSTLAVLQGKHAEDFLREQGVLSWIQRESANGGT